jgi:hypothetical protein
MKDVSIVLFVLFSGWVVFECIILGVCREEEDGDHKVPVINIFVIVRISTIISF